MWYSFTILGATPDLLDKAIAIVILFFILSMISERFVTWLKLHFGKRGNGLYGFSSEDEDLNITTGIPEIDKRKERKILGLNIVVGIAIALIANANFFNIMEFTGSDPYKSLGWKGYKFCIECKAIENLLEILLGCTLTGFFISLGSKFWHDTLDMLFYSKNLKEKALNKDTYSSPSLLHLQEFIDTPAYKIIELAITQNQEKVFNRNNINGVFPGKMYVSGRWVDCISVHLTDGNINDMPAKLLATLDSGRKIEVPVDYILNVQIPTAHVNFSDTIHEVGSNQKGTICCKLFSAFRNEFYLLTCSHVLSKPKSFNYGGLVNSPVLNNISPIGTLVWAVLSDEIDAALVQIGVNQQFTYSNGVKLTSRILDSNDTMKTKVTISGLNGKVTNGVVTNHSFPINVDINYGGVFRKLKNLILMSKVDINNAQASYSSISNPGDSGGLVNDENGNMIGMVIAGDNMFTYAVSLDQILKLTNTKIV